MQRTMQRHCAVFRAGLHCWARVRAKLGDVMAMMRDDLAVADRSMMFNTDLAEALEPRTNMLAQANVQSVVSNGPNREPRRAMRARIFQSATMRTGSSTRCPGSIRTDASGSTIGPVASAAACQTRWPRSHRRSGCIDFSARANSCRPVERFDDGSEETRVEGGDH